MKDKIWYDVIDRTTGVRDIVFSSQNKEEAIAKADELNSKGHKVYITENIIENFYLTRNIINNWNGFVKYVVDFGE